MQGFFSYFFLFFLIFSYFFLFIFLSLLFLSIKVTRYILLPLRLEMAVLWDICSCIGLDCHKKTKKLDIFLSFIAKKTGLQQKEMSSSILLQLCLSYSLKCIVTAVSFLFFKLKAKNVCRNTVAFTLFLFIWFYFLLCSFSFFEKRQSYFWENGVSQYVFRAGIGESFVCQCLFGFA